ncbi:MAG: SDR family NAD(P)-dependent oxidoreductase, partial [Thermoanaerobaculia bacterium]|nr:SDR family NAD(P)-dependent oxidoreductase [Thermoanaerobaculia bacterium]
DILVNNAGVVHGGRFGDVGLEDHLETVDVNLAGVVRTTHVFLPDLCAGDSGRLVNIASASGFVGLPWGVTYAATKWAVIGFSEGLRQELRETGCDRVVVTAVCPAYIETGLFRGAAPPRLTRALAADEVARRTVLAMCRGRRRLLLPWLVRTAPWMVALPSWLADPLSRLLRVSTSMRSWRGR